MPLLENGIDINDIKYPISAWETVGQGRTLRKRWRHGFQRMGRWYDGSDSEDGFDYYQAQNMDMASYPEARLRPKYDATITSLTGMDPLKPVYFIRIKPASAEYLYVFNNDRVFKFTTSDDTLVNSRQFSGEKCGRPVIFEGKIHLPLGDGKNARSLDTITTDTSDDTWGDLGASTTGALHFTTRTVNGAAQIVGAFQPNLVKISTDGTTFSPGAGFEVGDSSLAITDMLPWKGEVAVVRPDNVYRFDDLGNAVAVQDFVGRTDIPSLKLDDGANSFVFGPFLYWLHITSVARFVGDSYLPISPADNPGWVDRKLGLSATFGSQIWFSGTAYGRWAYFTKGDLLFQAFINEDGTLDWQGRVLRHGVAAFTRCGITEGPVLWIANSDLTLSRINLAVDGSLKLPTGSNRGAASETGLLYLPNIDFGLGGDRRFQLRRMAMLLLNGDAQASYQLIVRRDEGSEENVGDAITASGYTERTLTVGTNDLARVVQPGVKITLSGTYAPGSNDPRIRALYIEAVSPIVYRASISLKDDDLAETSSALTRESALSNLHALRGAAAVNIRQPGETSTFSGHIVGIEEHWLDGEVRADILIERFEWSHAK